MVTYVLNKIGQPKAATSYKRDEFSTLIDFVGNAENVSRTLSGVLSNSL